MSFLKLHSRAIVIATLFALLVVLVSVVIYVSLQNWRQNTISTNETLTRIVAERLHQASIPLVDSLAQESFFSEPSHTTDQIQQLDHRLSLLSDSIFTEIRGIEGGFFLNRIDEFYGYSYPTSPPPLPVYGPPPRSYTFIKNQVLRTIATGRPIVDIHQFDPAIFPLATRPIEVDGHIELVVWTRIHIERELPAIKLRQVVNVGALASALGFVIALLISVWQRRKILQMSTDLEQVTAGQAREVTESKGTLGFIARSINAMVRTMRDENSRREQLERQLHQKQKMASLGRVIAGVAHEVKTPLAIIKTRIQMWQQALRGERGNQPAKEVVSDDSLQLVVDEVDRLTDLVKRLLLFSKPQAATPEPTNINELLNQTISFSEPRISKERVDLVMNLDPTLPRIAADRNAIRQVLYNILANSVESIPETGKIEITTAYDANRQMCIINICDNGMGISDNLRQNIFDPFVTTKKKGFGLGLSISYEVIVAHGGTIQLFPNNDRGTTCRIELPVKHQVQDSSNEADQANTDR